LAFVATVMPLVWEDVREIGRAGLILTLAILFVVEYRAIDKEHKDYAEEQTRDRLEERESFKQLLATQQAGVEKILTEQNDAVKGILDQEQKHFERTLANLVRAQREEREQFTQVLNSEKELFTQTDQLFASLNGKLISANEPTPDNPCKTIWKGEFAVLLGKDSAFRVVRFPHIILAIRSQNVIWLDRDTNGDVTLFLDERAQDGKLLLRLDKDGFVIPPGIGLIPRRPDRSTVVIEDAYGGEVFRAHYTNPRVIQLSGIVSAYGKSMSLTDPFMSGCMDNGNAAVDLEMN
jgi:hypothetical protein